MDSKFRSRKFIITAGVQVFSCIALANGWLSGVDFTQISMVTVGAYNAANAAAIYAHKRDKDGDQ